MVNKQNRGFVSFFSFFFSYGLTVNAAIVSGSWVCKPSIARFIMLPDISEIRNWHKSQGHSQETESKATGPQTHNTE